MKINKKHENCIHIETNESKNLDLIKNQQLLYKCVLKAYYCHNVKLYNSYLVCMVCSSNDEMSAPQSARCAPQLMRCPQFEMSSSACPHGQLLSLRCLPQIVRMVRFSDSVKSAPQFEMSSSICPHGQLLK